MSLLVWLPLDGNLNNKGLANFGLNNYGATVDDNGKIGKCYSFDGIDDYLQFTDLNIDNLSCFSVCFWCYSIDGNLRGAFTIRQIAGGTLYHQFSLTATSLGFRDTKHSDWTTISFEQPSANTWTHYAFVYNKGSIDIYKNGELIVKQTNSTASLNSNLDQIRIGLYQSSSGSYYFKGKMNDIRIYDHALSAVEVKELSKALILHYKLDKIGSSSQGVQLYKYLQSDGKAWINTLIPYNSSKSSYRIECKFSQPSNVSSYDAVFSAYIGENNKCIRIIRGANDSKMWIYYNNQASASNKVTLTTSNSNIKEVVITSSTSTVTENGTTSVYNNSTPNGTTTTGETFYLFCQRGNACFSKTRIYYFRLYDNNILIKYFVPAKYNNKYGMWELVENQFYENGNSTGAFTVGPEIPINSTLVCDSSGYGCHGTIVGTYTLNTDSPKYSHCVYMNNTSTGNHIETPDFSKISDNIFSVSFWVKASKTKSQVLFGYTSKMVIAISSNSILYISPTTANGFSMAKFNTEEWNHIVAIRNNSSYLLYINGEKITSRDGSNYWTHTGNKIYLLNRNYNNNYGAEASMSDFRLYATVLTEDDVKYLYNVGAKIDNFKNLHCFELLESKADLTKLHKSGTFETNEFIEEDDTMSIKNTKKVNSNKFIEI